MYTGVYLCIYLCIPVYTDVYLCILQLVYTDVYLCILVYTDVYLCILVYTDVYLCILVYTGVYLWYTSVCVYWCIPVYIGVYTVLYLCISVYTKYLCHNGIVGTCITMVTGLAIRYMIAGSGVYTCIPVYQYTDKASRKRGLKSCHYWKEARIITFGDQKPN